MKKHYLSRKKHYVRSDEQPSATAYNIDVVQADQSRPKSALILMARRRDYQCTGSLDS